MHIAGHVKEVAWGLALDGGGVDSQQREAGFYDALRHLESDARYMVEPYRIRAIDDTGHYTGAYRILMTEGPHCRICMETI
jgi:hypothetical protein